MYIDEMLRKCGDFGRYQYILLILFCIINMLSSMHYYSQTIISFAPEHWCNENNELNNLSYVEIQNVVHDMSNPSCDVNDTSISPCHSWIYNRDFGYESMISQFNWVCDSAWKSTMGQSMFFIGSVIGTLIFGILADKIGRLPVLILANMMAFFGNGSTIFATNVITFSMCRFISGLATDSNFVMMYILVMEYIRPSMRTLGLNLCIGIFYCIGSMATPWVAAAVGSWKLFLAVSTLPICIVPFFYFVMSESAQWLIARNDIDAAIKCFQRVAETNGRTLDVADIDEFRQQCRIMTMDKNVAVTSPSLMGLFRTPRLRRNTMILFFKSMVLTLCYDAISRNVEGLGISSFTMFSLSATAIFPACIVILLLQDRIGRKAMASSSLFISGIFTASAGVIIANQNGVKDPTLVVSLAIIGRFGVTVAYNSGAQYATELIPTCVRAQGVAAVHVAGYALTFFSSYILYLSNIFQSLPHLILGTLSLAGAVLCLFLPETLNRTIPCTLTDGEEFGRGEGIFQFACFERKNNQSTGSTTVLRESFNK